MPDHFQPAVMTVQDFSRWARLGRTRIYEEFNSGALKCFKLGRRTLIRRVDAEAWLDRLQQPAQEPNKITANRL
ncbi:helix-turn-helix domain-containing protein [Sphingomonas sp. PWP1-2]|uniref:helix-turn-helix domain-containing protein n=1 Tax=Sphingomonas sp. PWP1-2 TaxID=2804558 RepID=UPI003CF12166